MLYKAIEQLGKEFKRARKGGKTLLSYPILRSTGWEAYRGVLAREKPKMIGKFDDLYFRIEIVNTFIQRLRQVKWGYVSSHEHSAQILEAHVTELDARLKKLGPMLKEIGEELGSERFTFLREFKEKKET